MRSGAVIEAAGRSSRMGFLSALDELRCRNGNLNTVCGRPLAKEAL